MMCLRSRTGCGPAKRVPSSKCTGLPLAFEKGLHSGAQCSAARNSSSVSLDKVLFPSSVRMLWPKRRALLLPLYVQPLPQHARAVPDVLRNVLQSEVVSRPSWGTPAQRHDQHHDVPSRMPKCRTPLHSRLGRGTSTHPPSCGCTHSIDQWEHRQCWPVCVTPWPQRPRPHWVRHQWPPPLDQSAPSSW